MLNYLLWWLCNLVLVNRIYLYVFFEVIKDNGNLTVANGKEGQPRVTSMCDNDFERQRITYDVGFSNKQSFDSSFR